MGLIYGEHVLETLAQAYIFGSSWEVCTLHMEYIWFTAAAMILASTLPDCPDFERDRRFASAAPLRASSEVSVGHGQCKHLTLFRVLLVVFQAAKNELATPVAAVRAGIAAHVNSTPFVWSSV